MTFAQQQTIHEYLQNQLLATATVQLITINYNMHVWERVIVNYMLISQIYYL